MKIVCEACGARYALADEKVTGKTFKVRCRKCSEVVVVRREASVPPADAAASPAAKVEKPVSTTRSSRRDAGLDLFAALHDEPSGAEPDGPSEGEDANSAAPPAVASGEMTGARKESSMLFSLDNLGTTATPAAAQPNGKSTSADAGSGLVDIRALATGPAVGSSAASSRGSMDELLSIGTSASPFAGSLDAPVLSLSRPRRVNTTLYAAVGVAAVAVISLVVVLVVVLGRDPDVRASRPAPATTEPVAAHPSPARPVATNATPNPDSVLATTASPAEEQQPTSSRRAARRHRRARSRSATRQSKAAARPNAAPASRGPRGIDELMNEATRPRR